MNKMYPERRRGSGIIALLLALLLIFPPFITGCGSPQSNTPRSASDSGHVSTVSNNNRSVNQPQQVKKGLNTGQKVAVLVGAAALYYIYNQHKNKQEQGPEGQYYLSKNGRVYYRDAQHRVHWVTPPPEGIQVPEAEARQYSDFQGYNNRPTGRSLSDLVSAAAL